MATSGLAGGVVLERRVGRVLFGLVVGVALEIIGGRGLTEGVALERGLVGMLEGSFSFRD